MGCVTLDTPSKEDTPFTVTPKLVDDIRYGFYEVTIVPTIKTEVASNQSLLTEAENLLDPVDLATGDFTYTNTFLSLPGKTAESTYAFTLNYRSRTDYE